VVFLVICRQLSPLARLARARPAWISEQSMKTLKPLRLPANTAAAPPQMQFFMGIWLPFSQGRGDRCSLFAALNASAISLRLLR
jgi:hypothetical protein